MTAIKQASGQILSGTDSVLKQIQSLHEEGQTGSLVLAGKHGHRIHVFFREGMIDAASSSQNGRRIGDYLFRDPHGSTSERDSLEFEARRQKSSFAESAISRGLVDTAGVVAAARSQAIELLEHALENDFQVESFSSSLRSYRVPARINFAFVKLELSRKKAVPFEPEPGMQIVLSKGTDIPAFPWHPQELSVLAELRNPNTFQGLLSTTGLEVRTLKQILGVFNSLRIVEHVSENDGSVSSSIAGVHLESQALAQQIDFPFEDLIPVVTNATLDERIVAAREASSYTSDQFKNLKILLGEAGKEKPLKVFTVSSPGTQDGKSFVSANLALSFSMDPGQRTIIIDCDLRRPSISKYLGVPTDPGLM